MRIAAAIVPFILAAAFALPAQTRKIVVQNLSAADVENLRRNAPSGVNIVAVSSPAQMAAEIADADAVIGNVNAQLLRQAKKLQWLQTFSAGVENLRFPEFVNSGVTLTNAKIIQGPNIADHAFAMLLSMTRGIGTSLEDKAKHEWGGRNRYRLVELSGKTAVIIGAGGIGMQIAQRARGFGMKTIAVDPKDISYTPLLDETVKPDRLDEVLPKADVVFVSAPHTAQSEGMIGPRQFELIKNGAYFIAVSRGKLYSTDALVKALDSKRLAGAGLDVTDPEPLPKDHPLWQFDNVVITPHVAGQSDIVQSRRMELFRDNIKRFVDGRPMLNVVDKQKGY